MLNPPFIQGFSRGVRGVGESTRGGTLYIPIWLSYATGVLDQSNETRLIDAQALSWGIDDVLQDISNFNPNIIVIDTNFSSLNNDIDIANLLKKQSGAITIMVGPPTSQFPNKILESGIDIVARNEYDLTLNEVVNNITKDLNFTRKMIEKIFGWLKEFSILRRPHFRGMQNIGRVFKYSIIVYNILRIHNLCYSQ